MKGEGFFSMIERIITQLGSPDRTLRHEAVEWLGETSDERAIPYLVGILKDRDPGIRDAAINALINIGGREVARAIIPFLYSDDVSLRNIAKEILCGLGKEGEEAILPLLHQEVAEGVLKSLIEIIAITDPGEQGPQLIPFLRHNDPNIRTTAAMALGKLKTTSALTELLDLLKRSEEWERAYLLEAISELGIHDTHLIDLLLAETQREDIARFVALDALAKLAEPSDYEKISPVLTQKELLALVPATTLVKFMERFHPYLAYSSRDIFFELFQARLKEESVDEQRNALLGMKILGDSRATEPLIRFARQVREDDEETQQLTREALIASGDSKTILQALKTSDKDNMAILVEVLGEIGDPTVVRELQSLMNRVDRDTKKKILSSLEKIDPKLSFDTFIEALKDLDGHVRGIAARALGRLQDKRAIPFLLDALLREPYRDIKEIIGEALSSYKEKVVEETFIGLLDQEREDLRVIAIRGLGQFKTERAKDCLLRTLKDKGPGVRKEVLRALGNFKGTDIAEMVAEALKDPERDVRIVAVEILGNDPTGYPYLLQALEDRDMWVRFKAVALLGERRVGSAEEAIIDLLSREEMTPVKVACLKALGMIGSARGIALLRKYTRHDDPYLREAARKALEELG